MGAAQSLHMLSDPELSANVAGIFAMSTFLPDDSVLPGKVAECTRSGGRCSPPPWCFPCHDVMKT